MPTYMKQGSRWLYDTVTNKIVGVKEDDGTESFFVKPLQDSSGNVTGLSAAGTAINISGGASTNIGVLSRNFAFGSTSAANVNNANGNLSGHPSVGASIDTAGVTVYNRIALEAEFDAIRIAIPNWDLVAVKDIKASYAMPTVLGAIDASSGDSSLVFTTDAPNGSPFVYQEGTNNPTLFTFNNCQTNTATLPAATPLNSFTPTYTWSDWMPAGSAARTDGGTFPLIDIALFYPANKRISTTSNNSVSNLSRIDKFTGGKVWRTWLQVGDRTQNGCNATASWYNAVPIIVQYRAKNKNIKQVLLVGDSIYEGLGNSILNWGAANKACQALRAAGTPVELCVATKTSADVLSMTYMANSMIDEVKPHVMIAELGTPNNGPDYVNFSGTIGARVAQGRRANPSCKFIFLSGMPYSTLSAANDNIRIASNAASATDCANEGFTFLDLESTVVNSLAASPRVLKPAYTSDGVHTTDACQDAIMPLLKPLIASAIA